MDSAIVDKNARPMSTRHNSKSHPEELRSVGQITSTRPLLCSVAVLSASPKTSCQPRPPRASASHHPHKSTIIIVNDFCATEASIDADFTPYPFHQVQRKMVQTQFRETPGSKFAWLHWDGSSDPGDPVCCPSSNSAKLEVEELDT